MSRLDAADSILEYDVLCSFEMQGLFCCFFLGTSAYKNVFLFTYGNGCTNWLSFFNWVYELIYLSLHSQFSVIIINVIFDELFSLLPFMH